MDEKTNCLLRLINKLLLSFPLKHLNIRGIFRNQLNISDEFLWGKTVNDIHPLTIFPNKLHHGCLAGF